MTEIAKDLLFSNFPLYLFEDNSYITEKDIEINFFFNSEDINQNKLITIKNKLQTIKVNSNFQVISFENFTSINNVKYSAFYMSDISKANFI